MLTIATWCLAAVADVLLGRRSATTAQHTASDGAACRVVPDALRREAEAWKTRAEMAERERDEMRGKRDRLRRELTAQRDTNHARNVSLDALHYVWCSGGCETGVHRYEHKAPLDEELVQAAVRNTRRLVTWWRNHQHRQGVPPSTFADPSEPAAALAAPPPAHSRRKPPTCGACDHNVATFCAHPSTGAVAPDTRTYRMVVSPGDVPPKGCPLGAGGAT